MKDFIFYFKIGLEHILSWDAADHLYFITALAIVYTFQDWKKVLVLVTAFTIGHAVTLYLSSLDYFRLDAALVEFAIPCTIVFTAVFNLLFKPGKKSDNVLQYILALCFGLVHGMGYANYIRMMLASNQNLVWGLFSFNIGLEMGQIVVVFFVLAIQWAFTKSNIISSRLLVQLVSVFILVVSFLLAIERFSALL